MLQIVQPFGHCGMGKNHVAHVRRRYVMVDNHLKEVDKLVRFGAEKRGPEHLTRMIVDDFLQQSIGLTEHFGLGNGHGGQSSHRDVKTLTACLGLRKPYMRERGLGKYRGGDGSPTERGAATVAKELAAHDTVIVEREISKLPMTGHVAHGPNMGSGFQVLIGDDIAPIIHADTGLIELQAGRVGMAPDGHKQDRKSTRLNSSHANISYAVFCL